MAVEPEDPETLRIRLSARREKSPSQGPLRTLMFPLRATPQLSPRARARHFAGQAAGKSVRPVRGVATGQRRVLVKARVVRMTPGAAKALMTHVRYVERDGVGAAGEEGRFFGRETNSADGRAFAGRCAGDRHHFRVIVNPEDGRELPDLKAYARGFMARVERDMGTRIDWIAGEHHDTGRPHLHLLLRGRREDGRDLVLPRDYVSHGLRGRAQDLATEILGPRLESGRSSGEALTANRFTPLDRTLIGLAREGRLAMTGLAGAGLVEADQALALRRLTHLEAKGFITRERAGYWRLPGDLGERLQAAGAREEREAAAGRAVWGTETAGEASRLEAVAVQPGTPVVGAYVGHAPIGASATGPQVVVVDLVDGRLGHVRTPSRESLLALDRVPEGAIVRLSAVAPTPRPSDLTIAEIARERGGVYSAQDHRLARPADRDVFIDRHVRRLEAMGRAGACEPLGEGRFRIPDGYAEAALRVDQARHEGAAVQLDVLDDRPLAEQVRAFGRTWLDQTLASRSGLEASSDGFGTLVAGAQVERAGHLKAAGLGNGEPLRLSAEDLVTLRTQEVQTVFARLGFPGRSVSLAKEGQAFSGVYLSRVHAGGRAFAVVEVKAGIILAPWRAALEACRGQAISGVLQGGAVDFTFGLQAGRGPDRGRGLEL